MGRRLGLLQVRGLWRWWTHRRRPAYSGPVLSRVVPSRLRWLCAVQNRSQGSWCRGLGKACSTRLVVHRSLQLVLVRTTADPTRRVYAMIMPLAFAAFEVMDKEPPLLFIVLASSATGAVGMLIARRRPIISALFVSVVLLGAFALYLEWSDSFVRESIIKEAGITYLAGSVAAILAGIGLPVFGAWAGSKNLTQSASAWRWTSGVSGGVLLGLTLFMCSAFVESLYYDYIFYPREKAEDHYIMPLRWQDITAESLIACALITLLLLSTYLLRSAFRRHKTSKDLANP